MPDRREYTFRYAQRTGGQGLRRAKYTVSPVYEGMFKEELDAPRSAILPSAMTRS